MDKALKVYTETGDVAAEFYSIEREGDKLIIDVKVLGAIRMGMIFPMGEVFKALRMTLCWGMVSFILLFPYFCLRRWFAPKGKEKSSLDFPLEGKKC